jgi:glutathione S-transferase
MLLDHLYTAFVTLGALVLYFLVTFRVGFLRGRHGIVPPSNDGPPEFLRARGVQANTLEHLALFLPALWLFSFAIGDQLAGLIGLIWIAARAGYALIYYRDPTKRLPPFMIALMASLALIAGALIGLIAIARVAATAAG